MVTEMVTEEDMNKMNNIVKWYLPSYSYSYVPDMSDDIRLDDDLSLYGIYGIPNHKVTN